MLERKKNVLIVDDDADQVDLIRRGLIREGFDVAGATEPSTVKNIVQKKDYDIVLLDIIMRGYGGEQVLADIMTYSPRSKVILISGNAKGSEIVKCMKMGAVDYLEKPTDVNKIATRIHVVSERPDFCHDSFTLAENLISISWKNIQGKQTSERGRALEQLSYHIFSTIPFFKLIDMNVRPESEEIDLELTNKGTDAFWSGAGGIIIVECKNLAIPTDRPEFDSFYAKLEARGNLCKTGFFISYNGFSKGFKQRQSAKRDKTVAMIDRDGLEKLVENENRVPLLERFIRDSTH